MSTSVDSAAAPKQQPTSRLCVKNIPAYVTDERLRALFTAQAEVTDVKIMRTRYGESRKFGFVGFRTPEAAAKAMQYFNKSFLDTARLAIEYAVPVGSNDLARPWSKYSEGSSRHAFIHRDKNGAIVAGGDGTSSSTASAEKPATAVEASVARLAEDAALREFLAIKRPRSQAKVWANDDDQGLMRSVDPMSGAAAKAELRSALGDESDDDETFNNPSLDRSALSSSASSAAAASTSASAKSKSALGEIKSAKPVAAAPASIITPIVDQSGASARDKKSKSSLTTASSVSDLDWLRSKVMQVASDDDGDDSDSGEDDNETKRRKEEQRLRRRQRGDSDDDDEDDASGGSDSDAERERARKAKARRAQNDGHHDSGDDDDDDDDDDGLEKGSGRTGAAKKSHTSKQGKKSANGDDARGDAMETNAMSTTHAESVDEVERVAATSTAKSEAKRAQPEATIADVGESGRLFIRNLPFSVTEDELRSVFGVYGTISEIHIPLDSAKRCKGFAYIMFMFPEHAVRALAEADGAIFQGRLIHVLPAQPAPGGDSSAAGASSSTTSAPGADGSGAQTSSYKLAKEAALKKAAVKEESWNSFFVPAASVLTAMSQALGVSKADIIADTDTEGGKNKMHAAVRLALSETQVIAETKTWLAAHGVNLSAFGGPKTKERSNAVLLVKNFPHATSEEELRRAVNKFGTVTRFLMPPNHTLAIAEFAHEQEARKAFRGLAFKRFKNAPLYLEWAPVAALTPAAHSHAAATADVDTDASAATPEDLLAADAPSGGGESLSVFVKNLNFDTTESTLKATFAVIGAVRAATIAKKKNTKTSGKDKDKAFLSMGFGFVEFVHAAHAHDAIKRLQNVEVDGHRLQLKLSQRGGGAGGAATTTMTTTAATAATAATSSGTDAATGKRKASTDAAAAAVGDKLPPSAKILVKNLAFEAGPKDLRQLFSTFGQVKSVRMPKKFDGSHRGFGFVELVTRQEAANAFRALADTHLYGRHLVMEWAKADESVDELRERAAAQATIERNDGFNADSGAKRRRTARAVDASDKSFAAAFGADVE